MDPLLKVENLETHFVTAQGTYKAVNGVSFELGRGRTLGLVGESGCGKSVTAFSLLRLIAPPGRIVGGRVWFSGTDLMALTEPQMRQVRGKDIAIIFQEPMTSLNPVLTIGNQIEEVLKLHRDLDKAERHRQVIESLRLVRIPDPERVARGYPHELSGGMRQRAMIAMALACRPRLLIADEPTTALDVTVQAQVLQLLRDLRDELDMSLLLITHDLGIVAEHADQVLVMYAGQAAEQGRTEEIFATPRHPYTRALLGALPRFDTQGRLKTIPGSVPSLASLPRGCSYQDRCDRVQGRCRQEDPGWIQLQSGQQARCFFPEGM